MNIAIVNNQTQAADLPEEIRNAFKLFSINMEKFGKFRDLKRKFEKAHINADEYDDGCRKLAHDIKYVSYIRTRKTFEVKPRANGKAFYLFASRDFCEVIQMIELYKKEINA